MRMMGRLRGFAARTRAAGDAGDEQTRIGQPKRQQRHAGEQGRGRETTRMRDVRRRRFLQMLRHGAGELADSRRGAVRMLVDGFVGRLAGIAKVRGNIHAMHARARGARGCAAAGRRWRRIRHAAPPKTSADTASRRITCVQFIGCREFQIRIGAAQMGERIGDFRAGLAVGQDRRDLKPRMTRDQAQQLAGHIAGAAEHNGRRRRAHSPTTLDSRTLRKPSEAMM